MPRGAGTNLLAEACLSGQHASVLFLAHRQRDAAAVVRRDPEKCLLKFFAFPDFRIRVHARLRRGARRAQIVFRLAGLELDLVRHRAMRDGRRLRSKVNDPYPRKLIQGLEER